MRIQLTIFLTIFSISVFASEAKQMEELFSKYHQLVNSHKTELVEEVFTRKFLKDNGGKKEFIEKVTSVPKIPEKAYSDTEVKWKKGLKDEIYFAKIEQKKAKKSLSKNQSSDSQFVVVKEDGKLKINGTLSDAD